MVVTQTTSPLTGHLLRFRLSEGRKRVILSPAQEAHSHNLSLTCFPGSLPATGPQLRSFPLPAHSVPAQVAHYFPSTPRFPVPLHYSSFCLDTHPPSLLNSQISASSRLNPDVTFSGKFSYCLCRNGRPPLCFPGILCILLI